MNKVISLIGISTFIVSCGGGNTLSLEEAKQVTLNYQGENFTPPPRGVDKLIKEIRSAGDGEVQEHICRRCETMDPDDENVIARLGNLSKLGIVEHLRGNSLVGLDYSRRAIKLLEHPDVKEQWGGVHRNQFDHTYFRVFHRAFRVALAMGYYNDAIKYMNKAIELNEEKIKPRKGKLVIEHAYLANAYASLGKVEEAEDALDEAEDWSSRMKYTNKRTQKHKLKHDQRKLVIRGVIEHALGNLRSAEQYYRDAIDLMADHVQGTKGSTWEGRAEVMGDYLVNNLLAQGRVAEAEAQFIVAIRYVLEKFGFENFVTAKTLQVYVRVLMARERYNDARKIINLAADIFKSLGTKNTSIQKVKLTMSLAKVYIAEGDWLKAKNIYMNLYRDLKDEPEVRNSLFNGNLDWAVVLAFNNKNSEADVVASAAVDRLSDIYGVSHQNTAIASGIHAMVKARSGNMPESIDMFKSAISDIENNDSSEAMSGENSQRLKLIVESYLGILHNKFKSGDINALNDSFYIAQLVQGKSVQNAVASSAARASIKDPELIKLVMQEQKAMQKIESGYNTIVTNSGGQGDAALVRQIKSTIDTLKKARDSILNEINNRFPDYANMVRPKPVPLENIAKVLRKDESLLLVYSGTNNIYTWTISGQGKSYFNQEKVNRGVLGKKVKNLRKALDLQVSSLKEVPVFDVDESHRLYNIVMRRSAHVWRGSKHLLIIADGVLSSLPFSTLVTEPANRIRHSQGLTFSGYRKVSWLVNSHATSYAPSVSTLVSLRQLKVKSLPQQKFAGFGNPVFGSKQVASASTGNQITSRGAFKMNMRGLRKTNLGKNLDSKQVSTSTLSNLIALPETADEVLQVAGALKVADKGNVFLGSAANESRVKTMPLNNRRVLMFATHALLPGDLDGLVQPAIALTSPTVAKGTGNDDGLLTMGEVMGLNLNADWVVLSACNTGAGSGKGATAVSGLGQAFFYAGARSLLVSHWPVETTSAKQITTGLFERQVSDKSLSRAEALNETVKDLIHRQTYKANGKDVFAYAHPVFWAPFTVVGDGAGVLH